MSDLATQLADAEARVAQLKARIAAATCAEFGRHRWKFIGCGACCCDLGDNLHGECSLPVHECEVCGDCDYGENHDSEVIRAQCGAEGCP